MKGIKLFLTAFLTYCCAFSYAQQTSKQITDKGIFPSPNKSPDEAVIAPLADDDVTDGDSSTDSSTNPAQPSGDNEYTPKASPSPASPKGDKEYFPSTSSNQDKNNSKKGSR